MGEYGGGATEGNTRSLDYSCHCSSACSGLGFKYLGFRGSGCRI